MRRVTRRVTRLTDEEFEAIRAAFPGEWVLRQRFRDKCEALSNASYVGTLLQTAGVTLPNSAQLVSDFNSEAKTRAQVLR